MNIIEIRVVVWELKLSSMRFPRTSLGQVGHLHEWLLTLYNKAGWLVAVMKEPVLLATT